MSVLIVMRDIFPEICGGFYRATLCVSVVFAAVQCPSVTLVYCIQTAIDIVKHLSQPDSPIILVL